MISPLWVGFKSNPRTKNIHGTLLILVAFSSGVNAIVTGALIDMHTINPK